MKKVLDSSRAPRAVGPYVHGRVLNGVAYLSGQLGLDPETGELKEGIEAQTKQAFSNIEYILECCEADLNDSIKVTVMLNDIDHFAVVNEIYMNKFQQPYPARTMFAVKDLPLGAMIEIEVIANVSNRQ